MNRYIELITYDKKEVIKRIDITNETTTAVNKLLKNLNLNNYEKKCYVITKKSKIKLNCF